MRDNVVLQVSFKETLMILDSLDRRAFDIKEVLREKSGTLTPYQANIITEENNRMDELRNYVGRMIDWVIQNVPEVSAK